LAKRSIKALRSLGATFKNMDVNGDRAIDKQEFYWGLKNLGCTLSKNDAAILLDYLDIDQNGTISYDEFLAGLRCNPNKERQAVIDRAFNKFDVAGTGFISVNDLAVVYDTSRHPKVRHGQIASYDVFVEFLSSFGVKGDGKISRAEWNDYYGGVSESIENDSHFVDLMASVWRL